MKIRIELSADTEEEIIIKCKEESEKINLIRAVLTNLIKGGSELKVFVGNTEYYVSKDDILFFETLDSKVYAHTKDKMYFTDARLFELEELMPSYFTRISKSAIVNVKQISSLRRELTGNGELTFKGSDKNTYFSRSYFKMLNDKIEEVRFSK